MTRGKERFIYLQLQLHCNLSLVRRLPQGSLLHEPVTKFQTNCCFAKLISWSSKTIWLIPYCSIRAIKERKVVSPFHPVGPLDIRTRALAAQLELISGASISAREIPFEENILQPR